MLYSNPIRFHQTGTRRPYDAGALQLDADEELGNYVPVSLRREWAPFMRRVSFP